MINSEKTNSQASVTKDAPRINWIAIKSTDHQQIVRTYGDQSRTSCGQDRNSKSWAATGQWCEGIVPGLCDWWELCTALELSHLAQTKFSWAKHLGMPHRAPFMSMSQHKEFQSGWWHSEHQGWKWKEVHAWLIPDPAGLLCLLLCELPADFQCQPKVHFQQLQQGRVKLDKSLTTMCQGGCNLVGKVKLKSLFQSIQERKMYYFSWNV